MTKRKAEDNEILIKSTPNTCTIVTMKLPRALGNKNLDPFFGVSKDGPCLTATEKEEMTGALYNLNLPAKLIVLQRQILFIWLPLPLQRQS